MKKVLTIIALSLTACTNQPEPYAYKATCTNGTQTMGFDLDGADYDGNQYTRQQSIDQLSQALTDDPSYQGTWTCK